VNGVFTRLLVPLVLGGCNPVSVGVASNGEMFSFVNDRLFRATY